MPDKRAKRRSPLEALREHQWSPGERVVFISSLAILMGALFVTTYSLAEFGPRRLTPDALAAQMVLVAGGAGAVGHAAIQLARWAGARVIATVSGDEKAELARAAGADHIVNYRTPSAADEILRIAPTASTSVVEVAAGANAALDAAVLAANGTVTCYATDGGSQLGISVGDLMGRNVRYQFVVSRRRPRSRMRQSRAWSRRLRTAPWRWERMPACRCNRFPLQQTGAAHDAVEGGAVGKVLIDVA